MSENPKKRSLTLKGHRTSISLEDAFWQALQIIAKEKKISIASLVEKIDEQRGETGLSTALRLTVLRHYQTQRDPKNTDPSADPS